MMTLRIRVGMMPLFLMILNACVQPVQAQNSLGKPLEGTTVWKMPKDPAAEMVEGIHRHLDGMLQASSLIRDEAWRKAHGKPAAVEERLNRMKRTTGVVDALVTDGKIQRISDGLSSTSPIRMNQVEIYRVRWPVFENVWMEGWLVQPVSGQKSTFYAVVIGDADDSSISMAGLNQHKEPRHQLAVRLAQSGGRVLVPTLLSRDDRFSGNPSVRFTNLSHREWIWRMAWETGRTLVGYEVSAVLNGLNLLEKEQGSELPELIYGHGEGGLIALLAGVMRPQVKLTWVSGYFQDRDSTQWLEPIDRTIWRQSLEFQDAELAAMIATSPAGGEVLIDRTPGPIVPGPKPAKNGRDDAADGSLKPADAETVGTEIKRAQLLAGAGSIRIYDSPGFEEALGIAGRQMGIKPAGPIPLESIKHEADENQLQKMMLATWMSHTQRLLQTSELRRFEYWKQANPLKPADWAASTAPLRETFWNELIGKMPEPSVPAKVESTLVYDQPAYSGYAVKIPVYPDVYAYGVLLLPKDLKPGEKRPVVVCQHGLEGRPDDIVDPAIKSVYNSYGAALAERGYIVFAPQNPYIGKERFRTIQRKAWPLGQSLFAVIFRQHERILDWLETLDQVDSKRIAFYGLSYGGKSAMRIPAALPRYCLSICSADFNEWVVKCTSIDRPFTYMYTIEYDMYEWDLASRFNYAEMAALIAPRPFQIERGHFDGVAPDEWIGYEFGKVKKVYDLLGKGDLTGIAYFNRGHEIDGKETFEFLSKHLSWPRGARPIDIKR